VRHPRDPFLRRPFPYPRADTTLVEFLTYRRCPECGFPWGYSHSAEEYVGWEITRATTTILCGGCRKAFYVTRGQRLPLRWLASS
jgi:hypothetical protein